MDYTPVSFDSDCTEDLKLYHTALPFIASRRAGEYGQRRQIPGLWGPPTGVIEGAVGELQKYKLMGDSDHRRAMEPVAGPVAPPRA